MSIRFGIIGAGIVGAKRAQAILNLSARVVAVTDLDESKARKISQGTGARVACDGFDLVQSSDIDAVVIATTNDVALKWSVEALRQNKHVLVEKPAGKNPMELGELCQVARDSRAICRIGFNHRFHGALKKAKELLQEGAIGECLFFRAKYGHGGRPGYDREWRADPKKGGGGELLDQGVHLIDLCRWMGGEFELEFGAAETFFWDMPVEDNGFLYLKSSNKKTVAWLHASCTEWKNSFEFEVFGKKGKLQVVGLGGSYGEEELRCYRVRPQMGVPELATYCFPQDFSWEEECAAFMQEISGQSTSIARPEDGLKAISLVYEVYRRKNILARPSE